MTTIAASPTALLGFGSPDGPWGIAVLADEPVLVLGDAPGDRAPALVTLAGISPGPLTGPGGSLPEAIAGAGFSLRVAPGVAPLCRVSGELPGHAPVSLPGAVASLDLRRLRELDSVRLVLGWLDEDDGLALSASRPRGARGQDRDEVSATVNEPAGAVDVEEARLSTTYGRDGSPRRMSLELWPVQDEDSYPHRSAGEVRGAAATVELAEATLLVHPLRVHRAGRDGAGVYVLARAR